ncbi:MAG: hypothetical protein A2445_03370 [Candidatus Jacksonbacteria bacterium RIFOXYC2_FULL_44_29]|nr:MAG: hypothetical protein A2240_04470 [Candidatus Jacksonbacteria bacterium RIFOXYA2_FULL_43_12]OGY77277.1 MAG: hypothetical protein A2295_04965 [Candidatus Jacksonbacteria bacterium RIFOXYB2_FULL_44_15]OGY78260.1 MAG: hypothetical protein A2445_03370 [Candidatus Jacksonbacteria bacterium RIFOXYC2_FULL_44_29]OGY78917.1 MAG: hypothetical protein A2550_05265 [Candidatus Jacksonbacteria bacterium RIFOXYD2_FULL_43_21]HBH46428.1 hypothetical protein [Candidatus Jacksonbacteria bacterium]
MQLDHKGKRKIFFLLGGILCLAVVITALILPQAEIRLKINEKNFKKTYQAKLEPSLQNPLPSLDLLPAKLEPISETNPEERYIFTQDNIIKFLVIKIESEIEPDEKINQNSLKYQVEVVDKKNKMIKIYAETKITPNIDQKKIKLDLRGHTVNYALSYLKNLPVINQADIKIKPKFLPFLPIIQDRIRITQDDEL